MTVLTHEDQGAPFPISYGRVQSV